ncbi:MAG TPA: O-antigen ligase [Caulobacteraceae bacterium]|nr:O-antigen ligase [Caulobacteraceae bacterium]
MTFAQAPRASLGDRVAFWTSAGLMLAFSECWVMFLTGPGEPPPSEPVAAMIRLAFYPMYVVALALALTRIGGVGKAILRAPALLLLLAVTFASIAWSIDPEVTTRRCIALLLTMLGGVTLAERFAWPQLLEVLATALGITVVLSFALALFLPEYGLMQVDFPGAWRGAWSHKNNLGYYMSVSFIVFVASAIANAPRRWLWAIAAAGAFALILLSTSKTSLVSCAIAAACMSIMAITRRGPAWAVAGTCVLVCALVGLAVTLWLTPDLLFGLVGKDITLTGRTSIWSAVLRQIAQRPLLGYGYGAVWNNKSIWGPLPWISLQQGFVTDEAHNTWLGIWLELGYVGLGAWALLFAGVWLRALRTLYVPAASYFPLPFLAVFSLHGVTESIALVQNDLVWLMFTATAIKLAMPPHPRSEAPSDRDSSVSFATAQTVGSGP